MNITISKCAKLKPYIPNMAKYDSPWTILCITLHNTDDLDRMVDILENIEGHFSIAWRPSPHAHHNYWISFELESDLIHFRLTL